MRFRLFRCLGVRRRRARRRHSVASASKFRNHIIRNKFHHFDILLLTWNVKTYRFRDICEVVQNQIWAIITILLGYITSNFRCTISQILVCRAPFAFLPPPWRWRQRKWCVTSSASRCHMTQMTTPRTLETIVFILRVCVPFQQKEKIRHSNTTSELSRQMFMYICIYVHIYIYIYIHIHMNIYIYMYVLLYAIRLGIRLQHCVQLEIRSQHCIEHGRIFLSLQIHRVWPWTRHLAACSIASVTRANLSQCTVWINR